MYPYYVETRSEELFASVKKIRTQLGMTQMELAHQTKLSLPTIQNIESNRANPSLETLQTLAHHLGLELKIDVRPAPWDLLAFYGAPLLSSTEIRHASRDAT